MPTNGRSKAAAAIRGSGKQQKAKEGPRYTSVVNKGNPM